MYVRLNDSFGASELLYMFLLPLLWWIHFFTMNYYHKIDSQDLCECVNLSYFPDRSEWRLQHHGSLWARAEASSRICLHHAQSHEWSGELPVLLTNTLTREVEPGQFEQVRQNDNKKKKILDLTTIILLPVYIWNPNMNIFQPVFSFFLHFCQSASIRFAPRDQWHYRSCWVFHKALWAPHLAVHKGFALPAAKSRPHWDRHRPHGVRQALLPSHLQLYQTGVQKTFGNLLTSHLIRKNIHSTLIFTDCAIHLCCLQYLL